MAERIQTFEPFAKERSYIQVNEKLVAGMLKRFVPRTRFRVLDIAAGTGLLTSLVRRRAHAMGAQVESLVVDVDLFALREARREAPPDSVGDYVCASADCLPFPEIFDMAIFANSLHLLDERAKVEALAEARRVLRPGGVLAMNTTFYTGGLVDDSRAFYGRWIRQAVVEINRACPNRTKSDRAQSTQTLGPSDYRDLLTCSGFRVLEVRERRVLLSQSAVRAISGYRDFAMGALRANEEDAKAASRALQDTVQQTFRDLQMKYLPRNWLEIIAVRPQSADR